ncbi:hypothetical protein NLJ89_g12080 [Agrocybe chaxingu]|uniref:Uncharacterized protein n=1 Tax=Agrocybe chaxingu TaxID=84603 RepID=A0A9W8JNX7_9AGAR|nr:hypothetical protein NLJ89_g12080 [Agrocybe chaxingu]
MEHPQEVDVDQIPEPRISPTSGVLPSQVQAVGSALASTPASGAEPSSVLPPAPASRAPSPLPSLAPSRCPSRQPSPPASPPAQTPSAGDNNARLVTRPTQVSPAGNSQPHSAPSPMEIEPTPPATAGSERVMMMTMTTTTTPISEPLGEDQAVTSHATNGPSIQPPSSAMPVSTLVGTTHFGVDATMETPGLQPPGSSQEFEDAAAVTPMIVDASLKATATSPQHARKDHILPSAKGQKRKRSEAGTVDVGTSTGANTRPSKRNRDGDSSSTALETPEPTATTPTAHEWFEKARRQFSSEGLGAAWAKLLEEWEAFEEEEDAFDDKRVLPAKGRPKSVGMWISRARLPTWRPSEPDAKADEKHFKAWWATLQQTSQVANGKVVSRSTSGDWSALRLPGVNGIQSVVAALFFWGLSASRTARTKKPWTAAVQECTEVFKQLRLHACSAA